ncbi:ABC-type nitrate/sulfonate/bicarbonate transport system permease component [Bradyrhizobium sp. GM5.1]
MRSLVTKCLGIVLFVTGWQLAGARSGDAMLATPVASAAALVQTLREGTLWSALGALLGQMILGYAAALIVGIPLGIAMGRSRPISAIVKPWAAMLVVVSAAALVPLLIIVLGRGILFMTVVVFAASVWYVVLTISQAAKDVSPRLLAVARVYDASPAQCFRYVILPALYPYIMIALRIGFVHALRAAVTAEMFISVGFGGLLNDAGLDLSTAGLFALIAILMALSLGATSLMRWIAGRTAPWYASRATG